MSSEVAKVDWLGRARARQAAKIVAARDRTEDFIEYAFSDEETGGPITIAPFHREWQELMRRNKRCVIIAPVEHGKSVQAIGKALHLLGEDPRRRGAIISNTQTQAEKMLRTVRQQIDENPRVREVFPQLVPSDRDGDPWGQHAITVKRPVISKDPSLAAFGAYGAITDSRVDFLIVDDIMSFENTATQEQREKLLAWFDSTVMTRLTRNAIVIFIGTPWHPEDLLFTLQGRRWSCWWKGAIDNPDDDPQFWRPLWPERWSVDRLMKRRADQDDHAWARKMLCKVRLESNARFKTEWWDRACVLGRGLTFIPEAPKAAGGIRVLPCFAGVDLGIGKKSENARSVITVAALLDNGRKRICDIQSGHWTAPEILARLVHVYHMYQAVIMVESNAAQDYIVQMASEKIPVHGRATGANKHHEEFGVEGLAVQMKRLEWLFPSGPTGNDLHPELRKLRQDVLYYNPAQHTGDHLMSWWICAEAVRMFNRPMSGTHDTLSR